MNITLIFTLSGLLLLMLMVAFEDARICVLREFQAFDDAFGHDSKVFPDYLP